MADISAILNVHNEGLLAHSSFLSLLDAKAAAEARGLSVEILVVADTPDHDTARYLEIPSQLGAKVLETTVDDLGLARNVGVQAASSRFVAFLDGDDIWSANWLADAHSAAVQDNRDVVWHPEASLYFGDNVAPYWLMHPDMDADVDLWVRLALQNPWTSLAFTAREIHLHVPYRRTELTSGFGYEDWAWNADTIADGIIHKVVPRTGHLLRVKGSSLVRRTGTAKALMTPSHLFRSALGRRAPSLPRNGADRGELEAPLGTRHPPTSSR
jgi:glycosyltransferase involved in cell wall biosynthesis